MILVDKEKVKHIIDWWRKTDTQGLDSEKYFFNPLMAAFGDNVDEILKFLNELDIDDLDYISGCFENIYGKFMTEDVWDALGALEEKIKNR